jgi:phenylpropionate dioxygenase-like ring-hydroxylating dioxygenase large terminal subunit
MGSPRFPFPMPLGWYHVADAAQLADGLVARADALGRDLVAWRDGDGVARVHDAVCPHLGAHLGVGGRVEQGCIRCPFHGWRFASDGTCTEIPYSDRVNRKARLQSYPTVERHGLVFAWYHPAGAPPQWELPEVPELDREGWTDATRSEFVIASIPQEMGENSVDPAHFRYVHGTSMVAVIDDYVTDGPRANMCSTQGMVTRTANVMGRIDVETHGPGFSITRFAGIVDAVLLATTTPIDTERTRLRFHFTFPEAAGALGALFVAEVNKQVGQDIPIWEHKRYLAVPALADTDGPIMRFRSWYRQFYVNPDGSPFVESDA